MFYNFRKNKKAFTLVELIVVIAIIAVLATAAGLAVSGILKNSRKTACINNAKSIAEQINLFEADPAYKAANKSDATNTLKKFITDKLPNEVTKITNWGSLDTKNTSTISGSSGSIIYEHEGWKATIVVSGGVATFTESSTNPVEA